MSLSDFFNTRYFIPGVIFMTFFVGTAYPGLNLWVGRTYNETIQTLKTQKQILTHVRVYYA